MTATASIKAVVTAEDKASPTIARVAQSTDKLGTSIRDVNNSAQGGGSSFSKLASSFAIGAVAGSALISVFSKVGSAISGAFSSTTDFEQYRIAFETMLGSADAARSMLQNLSDFAQKTPFTLPQVVEGAKQLLAYGISARDIIPDFNALGNIAAGVGRDKLPELTLAFGQVATKGRLMGQEIRQFTEAGVPLVQQLAKTFNTTTQNITAMSEKGQISFGAVREALYGMSEQGGRFFNLMLSQSKTFGGTMSNVSDEIGRIAREIMGISETGDIQQGGPFYYLKKGAGTLLTFLDENSGRIAAAFQTVGSVIMGVFSVLQDVFRIVNPGFALATVGAYLFARMLVGTVMSAIATVAAGMSVLNIALVAVSLAIGYTLTKAFGGANKQVAQQTKNLGDNTDATTSATAATGGLGQAQDDLGDKIQKVNDDITKENRTFSESMAQMVKDAQDKVKSVQSSMDDENASFKDSQEQAIGDHNDRVQKIQQQIGEETNLGVLGDKAKLASYQAELDKENAAFAKQQAKDQAQHDKKLADLQSQYDAETELLKKHSSDILSVQGVMLLDEIDALKRSHAEQLQQYDQQKADIVKSAQDTAGGIGGAVAPLTGKDSPISSIGNAFDNVSSSIKSMKTILKPFGDDMVTLGKKVEDYLGPKFLALYNTVKDKLFPQLEKLWRTIVIPLNELLGKALVISVGLVVDGLNMLITAVTSSATWLEKHRMVALALGIAFGSLAAAMALGAAFNAVMVGFATLTLVTIPSLMTTLGMLGGAFLAALPIAGIIAGVAVIVGALMKIYNVYQDIQKIQADVDKQQKNINTDLDATAAKAKTMPLDLLYKIQQGAGYTGSQGVYKQGSTYLTGYASGTDSATPGLHIVGENGPEILNFKGGERVTDAPTTKSVLGKNQAAPVINISVQAGAFMGTKSDARKFAVMMQQALADAMSAKGATA